MHVYRALVLLIYLASVIFQLVISHKKFPESQSLQEIVRYGRSGNKNSKINENRMIDVRPRGHSFYLGPRYGKRSRVISTMENSAEILHSSDGEDLSCTYSGVSNLYRCTSLRGLVSLTDNSI